MKAGDAPDLFGAGLWGCEWKGVLGEAAIEGVEGWLKAEALAPRVGKRDVLP